jgi:hypothetical protein
VGVSRAPVFQNQSFSGCEVVIHVSLYLEIDRLVFLDFFEHMRGQLG